MDNNARNRYELHSMVTNIISGIMEQNQVPAYMMEDALIDVLSIVKEVSFRECMAQVAQDGNTHENEIHEPEIVYGDQEA